jgi:hypothetical protein
MSESRIDPELRLTPKGLDFIRTAARIGDTPEQRPITR